MWFPKTRAPFLGSPYNEDYGILRVMYASCQGTRLVLPSLEHSFQSSGGFSIAHFGLPGIRGSLLGGCQ